MEHSLASLFIARWQKSGSDERANYQIFLSELCDVLGVARPEPFTPIDDDNAYVFERNVTFHHPDGSASTGRIDLYKRAHFILEAKQGVEKKEKEALLSATALARQQRTKKGTAQRGSAAWDEAMLKARGQAEQYARALPASEGRPPFLVIVDVGHYIELYSEFTRTGDTYVPFPDPRSHRILLSQLENADICDTLRLVFSDPLALDPAVNPDVDQRGEIVGPNRKRQICNAALFVEKLGRPRGKWAEEKCFLPIEYSRIEMRHSHCGDRFERLSVNFGLMFRNDLGIIANEPLATDGKPAKSFRLGDIR